MLLARESGGRSFSGRRRCTWIREWRHLLVLLVGIAIRAPLCLCQSYTPDEIAKVNQACSECDGKFLPTVLAFQNNFLGIVDGQHPNLTALDIGSLHCLDISQIGTCYKTCLQGYSVVYTSSTKTSFQAFYSQFCDTECRLAFLPACYLNAGVSFNLYQGGCDLDQLTLTPSISACIDLWMNKQNCRGVCTAGQRAATGLMLALDSICWLPQWEYACGLTISTCLEETYGPYGSNFIAGGPTLNGPGSEGCRTYGKSYSECLNNTVNGRVILGNPPYTVEYDQPCMDYMNVVTHLIGLSNAAVEPLCDHPLLSLSAICSPATTTTTVVYTSAASLLTAKANTTVEEQSTMTTALPTSELPTTEAPTTTESATTSSTSSTEQPTTTALPTVELLTTEAPTTTESATTSSTSSTEQPTTTALPTVELLTTEAPTTTESATTSSTSSTEQPTTTALPTVELLTTEAPTTTESATTSSTSSTEQQTTTALPTVELLTTEAPTTTESLTTSSTFSTERPTTTTVVSTAEPSTTEALTSSSAPGTTSSLPTENATASPTKKPCKKRKRK